MSERWKGVDDTPSNSRNSAARPSEPAPADTSGYFLTTKRLAFRCWTARDETLAIDLWCNAQVTAFIGGPWTRELALERLAQEIAQQTQYGMQYWPVFLLAGGRHAGCAGLRPYQLNESSYELGVHLLPEFWEQGIAREASEAIIPYAFEKLSAAAIVAGHHPRNAASGRLLKRLGFAYQDEKLYIPTGLMHPMYLLSKDAAAAIFPLRSPLPQ